MVNTPAITKIKGGVTAPSGFLASSIYCGLKKNYPGQEPKDRIRDLALIYSEAPAATVGFFTTNQIQATPVKICKSHLKTGLSRVIIVNSGNANCCTGKQGWEAATRITSKVAKKLGVSKTEVLPVSTGIIGRKLPAEKICAVIDKLVAGLDSSLRAGSMAAQAILTTDTRRKETAVRVKIGSRTVTIGGMAKGSGMIAPHMATMLCFITTDVKISPEVLKRAGKEAMEESFNNLTIDGDMSTNDTVLIMANGLAGNRDIRYNSAEYRAFCAGLNVVCVILARMIAADGEGATKLIEITVKGARTKAEAKKVAGTIARSNLVKTMVAGGDPNWGRIVAAAGASGIRFNPDKIQLYLGKYCVFKDGQGQDKTGEKKLKKAFSGRQVDVTVDLKTGQEQARFFTCDLTEEYVRINAAYST